jgi:hypothetical protein
VYKTTYEISVASPAGVSACAGPTGRLVGNDREGPKSPSSRLGGASEPTYEVGLIQTSSRLLGPLTQGCRGTWVVDVCGSSLRVWAGDRAPQDDLQRLGSLVVGTLDTRLDAESLPEFRMEGE